MTGPEETCNCPIGFVVPIPRLPVEGLNTRPVVVIPNPVVFPVPVTYVKY